MSSFKDLSSDYEWTPIGCCSLDYETFEKIFGASMTTAFPGYDADEVCKNASKEMNEKNDNVNHPSHYTKGGIECIDAIKASMSCHEYHGYLKGNVIKYLWRYRLKGHAKEDLKKAQWYLNKLVEELDWSLPKKW